MPDPPSRETLFHETPSVTQTPDPFLTASLYCAGHLDAVLYHVVRPFWSKASRGLPEASYLWTMRYGRCGEHLKLRLHGDGAAMDSSDSLRGELEALAAPFFAALDGEPPPRPTSQRGMPAVDVDDDPRENHPDRSLRFTTYRRSSVALGSPPYMDDEEYLAHFTHCQGRACDFLLEDFALDATGRAPYRVRFNTLAKLLIAGLATLALEPARRTAYLLFHRDWLVRFPLLRNNSDPEHAAEALAHFEQRLEAMAAALEPLGAIARAQWSDEPPPPSSTQDVAWRGAMADFAAHVEPLSHDPAFDVDPFAPDKLFSPIFKVFHGVANQLGLDPFEEAQIHHFLARLTDPEGSQRFELAFEPTF